VLSGYPCRLSKLSSREYKKELKENHTKNPFVEYDSPPPLLPPVNTRKDKSLPATEMEGSWIRYLAGWSVKEGTLELISSWLVRQREDPGIDI
jgi:hypothetical protein